MSNPLLLQRQVGSSVAKRSGAALGGGDSGQAHTHCNTNQNQRKEGAYGPGTSDHLYRGKRVLHPRSGPANAAGGRHWQIRTGTAGIPTGT